MAKAKTDTAAADKKTAAADKKSAPAKKAATEKKASGTKKPNALQTPVQPSDQLAEIVGKEPLARGEVVSKMWDYIKKNKLQDPKDGREILADDKLEKLFGKKKVNMFELNKILSSHLS
jgi:chromatin remodeling complex protein RSC6